MKIQKVTDPAFRRYGKVLEGYNFGPLLKEMKHTPVPEDVVYVPSAEELEALDVEKELKNRAFGGLPVQIGYCNGHNKKLNALEDVYKRQGLRRSWEGSLGWNLRRLQGKRRWRTVVSLRHPENRWKV